ncbi:MAG TPA: oxygenase MpaB family protein [Allosphingosinicella sp.]|jgi:uncharacterized protein (DUF2236 family)|uniref:oxygenase MpaB family protein n=1 Tax=Allosphingosinicella sp. TaxID=2823234 RepID=UPI002F29E1AD
MRRHGPLKLPLGLQGLVERTTKSYLEAGGKVDFAYPPGEPALAGPDSVCWQVFRNPVSLFVGGIAAVILELAEPRVREGVWAHSSFRGAPIERLQRTGLAAMVTVYGPRSVAETMIGRIVRLHEGVSGTTPGGLPYSANDPELLTWVHATAAFGFLQGFTNFVHPLSATEQDAFYAEGVEAGRLYGVPEPPACRADMARILDSMAPELVASPILLEFLGIMQQAPVLPPGARLLQPMLVRAAISILPAWARRQLQLGKGWDLGPAEERLLRAASRLAQRLRLDTSPAAQACVRLGLPIDHLQSAWAKRTR